MGRDSRLKWERRIRKVIQWKTDGKGHLVERLLSNINKKEKLFLTFDKLTEEAIRAEGP